MQVRSDKRVFEHVFGMKKLKVLDVGFSRVNDDGLDALALEELHIGGDKMSGLAVPLLRSLPALKHLDVNGSQRTNPGRWGLMLTDVNIEFDRSYYSTHLLAMKSLEELNLGDTSIGDTTLDQLEGLKRLPIAACYGCQVQGSQV
ncbi:MAG TPA: hypothetical protein VEX68_09975 [Bryobacteraceae bacterium]|nr:hypothetical protein [Bryobacteraceae bacterium]